jgi:hypothetical protein
MTSEDLREAARKRLEAKSGFWRFLVTSVLVVALVNVIWAVTSGGYYWPLWPTLGLGIALAFSAANVFGPGRGYVSADRVDAEVRRMTRDR